MQKKFIMSCMAVAAVAALVLPAVASGSPVLTESGVTVALGSSIEGKSTGAPTFTGAFNGSCSSAVLKGTVTKNNATKIEWTIPAGSATFTGTGTGGDCTSAFGSTRTVVNSELCFVTGASDTFIISGCGANIVFTQEVTGTGSCKYSTAALSGTFTTSVTPAVLKISEQEIKKVEGPFFCPASGKLDIEFDLYTAGTNTGLTIS
jgi:hypothetical protein